MLRHQQVGDHGEAAGLEERIPGKRTLTMDLPAPIQRRAAPAAGPGAAPEANSGPGPDPFWFATGPTGGGGAPMAAPVRVEMERAFEHDFSDVRIHEGPQAAAVGAVAYTQGADLHFQPGRYDPGSAAGRELLGHELTHVVQQRQGRVAADAGPLGKDAPINRDGALEAEADQVGARVARGEPAGLSGSRTSAGTPAGAIQRYADVTLDAEAWRRSDGNRILTRGAAGHDLYAAAGTIAAGEQALAAAGSFITLAGAAVVPAAPELAAQVAQHNLQRVTPAYRPRGPAANHAQTPAAHKGNPILGQPGQREPGLASLNANGAGPLVTPAQCIDAARVVMGVTGGFGARDREMAVGATDGDDHVYTSQSDGDFAAGAFVNMRHAPSSTDAGALTVLNRKLLDFIDSREFRGLVDEAATRDAAARWRLMARQLSKGNPSKAWTVLHQMKTELPAVYPAFAAYAGIDAAAAPEVGEALVTYIPETKEGDGFKTNRFLYNALVARLTLPVVTQMGITPATTVGRITAIVQAAASAQDPNHAHRAALGEELGNHEMWNMHWAGVILTDGSDYASLENDASTKIPSRQSGTDAAATATGGDINASWRFQLYGSERPGQSFHDQMLAGGDFGDFASTTRFRRQRAGEGAIGKAQGHRVYGLRMPAGTGAELVDRMRWELLGQDPASAAGASAAEFAATLVAQTPEGDPELRPEHVRIAEVRLLERAMPVGAVDAIGEALELIDVWRLRAPGPAVVRMETLAERLRNFHNVVKYLLSLGADARPVARYQLTVNREARKREVDAEVRPEFLVYRELAASLEARRTPSTTDGQAIGLLFHLLGFLDNNVLWSYERSEAQFDTLPLFATYDRSIARLDAEADRYADRLDEARQAKPILVQCRRLFDDIVRIHRRLSATMPT